MSFYLSIYRLLPGFLKRRINPLEYAIEVFVRSANPTKNSVVLDAGAGETRFRKYFLDHHYVALDSRVGDTRWDYSCIDVCGDLAAIPLAADSVDRVISVQVLEHVPDPKTVLTEFYRVLKPEGRLYLTVPQGWHEHQQPNDYFRFTRYALRSLLNSTGFKEISVDPLGGYFQYLGQRMTYVPKVLFEGHRGARRLMLFPLELGLLFLCCFVAPLFCYYLDLLDHKREFTLCYRCLAVKQRG